MTSVVVNYLQCTEERILSVGIAALPSLGACSSYAPADGRRVHGMHCHTLYYLRACLPSRSRLRDRLRDVERLLLRSRLRSRSRRPSRGSSSSSRSACASNVSRSFSSSAENLLSNPAGRQASCYEAVDRQAAPAIRFPSFQLDRQLKNA